MSRESRKADRPEGTRRLELFKLPDSVHVAVKFLSNPIFLPTHYVPRGSRYCPGGAKCLPAFHKNRVIWKGYLPCQVWGEESSRWASFVFELTEELGRRFKERQLRGEIWEVWRLGEKAKQAPLTAQLLEQLPPDTVADAFEMDSVIFELYRVKLSEIEVFPELPLPKRLYLPDEESAAPKGLTDPRRR